MDKKHLLLVENKDVVPNWQCWYFAAARIVNPLFRVRRAAYENFANSHVLKPVDLGQFVAAILQLRLYWIVLKGFPPRPGA